MGLDTWSDAPTGEPHFHPKQQLLHTDTRSRDRRRRMEAGRSPCYQRRCLGSRRWHRCKRWLRSGERLQACRQRVPHVSAFFRSFIHLVLADGRVAVVTTPTSLAPAHRRERTTIPESASTVAKSVTIEPIAQTQELSESSQERAVCASRQVTVLQASLPCIFYPNLY
jgi:hypothetical protein